MKTLFTVGTALLFTALVAGYCPEVDSITPCTCYSIEDGISVECKGPENADRIPPIIRNLERLQNLELVLESLTLPVTESTFKDVTSLHLHNVHLEMNSSSLTWLKLTEVIVDSSSVSNRLFPNFKDSLPLKHYEISRVDIPIIGSDFRESVPSALTYLDIRKTKTFLLEPHVLSHLKNLQYFIMVDLPLYEFPRDALPALMPSLHTFILGNTKIETLEPDFFDGMPKLEVLMLNGNELTTLDFNLFAPVENQLTHLLAERNPLVCDCNLLWLASNTQKKGSMKVLATCKDDETLKRKEVTLLDENEYCT